MTTSLRECYVCDEQNVTKVYSHKLPAPSVINLPRTQDICICNNCKSVFSDFESDQPTFDEYYRLLSRYSDDAVSTGSGTSDWDKHRLNSTADFFSLYLESNDLSIVDIGCGCGGLLASLKEAGYTNLCGVDPSKSCVDTLVQTVSVRGLQGSLFDEALLDDEIFDVVILTGVLEHIYDLDTAMKNISRFCNQKDGLLLIEVPDVDRYFNFANIPFQDFNLEHINHFSSISLQNLMERYGYKMVSIQQRDVAISESHFTPAITAVFKRELEGQKRRVHEETDVEERIQKYITKSNLELDALNSILTTKLEGIDRIVIWGAGQLCLKLLQLPVLRGIKIEKFLDSNAMFQGASIDIEGVDIISPSKYKNEKILPILITTIYHDRAIRRSITDDLSWANQIISLEELK